MVQAHDSLIDSIKRAGRNRSDDLDELQTTLNTTEPMLAKQADLTLQTLRTYLDRELDSK